MRKKKKGKRAKGKGDAEPMKHYKVDKASFRQLKGKLQWAVVTRRQKLALKIFNNSYLVDAMDDPNVPVPILSEPQVGRIKQMVEAVRAVNT